MKKRLRHMEEYFIRAVMFWIYNQDGKTVSFGITATLCAEHCVMSPDLPAVC